MLGNLNCVGEYCWRNSLGGRVVVDWCLLNGVSGTVLVVRFWIIYVGKFMLVEWCWWKGVG